MAVATGMIVVVHNATLIAELDVTAHGNRSTVRNCLHKHVVGSHLAGAGHDKHPHGVQ